MARISVSSWRCRPSVLATLVCALGFSCLYMYMSRRGSLKNCSHSMYYGAEVGRPKRRRHRGWTRAPKLQATTTPRHIALAFHGHYDRQGTRFDSRACSDFFSAASNIEKRLLSPLREQFDTVDVYFHTYRHRSCRSEDEALVQSLQPVAYSFTDETTSGLLPRIIDSFVEVLELIFAGVPQSAKSNVSVPLSAGIQKSGRSSSLRRPDVILLCRFDVVYRHSVMHLGIHWDKVNFAFRDTEQGWRSSRKVSDLFTVVPSVYAEAFQWSLEASCCYGRSKRRLCDEMKEKCEPLVTTTSRKASRYLSLLQLWPVHSCERPQEHNPMLDQGPTRRDPRSTCAGPLCPGHLVFRPLVKIIGEENIHFIDNEFRSSNIEINKEGSKDAKSINARPFLAIDRSCSTRRRCSGS